MLSSNWKSLRAENMHSTMKKRSRTMSDGTNKKSTTKTLTKKKKKKKIKRQPVAIEATTEPVEKLEEEKIVEELQRQEKKVKSDLAAIEAAAKSAEEKLANRICAEAKQKKILKEVQEKQEHEDELKIDIVHHKILLAQKNGLNGSIYPGGAKESNIIALDCEMVGVGLRGVRDALARVSIVNFSGDVILDKLVKTKEKIEDYRTKYSGIAKGDLDDAEDFDSVQKQVHDVIKGKILVAHSAQNDLKVLMLSHPKRLIRDTGKYKGLTDGRRRSLKNLCEEKLCLDIQSGPHDSVEDARATLLLYKICSKAWEKDVAKKQRKLVRDTALKAGL